MSFDDILDIDEIFDFEDDSLKSADEKDADVTKSEKNAGLWDTGKKENIWRSSGNDSVNGVWDSGGHDETGPDLGCDQGCAPGQPCDAAKSCDPDCEPVFDAEDAPDDEIDMPEPDSGGGMFDDI